jgi:hypothetical protein
MYEININTKYVSAFTTQEAIKNQQGAKDSRFIIFMLDILFRATNVSFERE